MSAPPVRFSRVRDPEEWEALLGRTPGACAFHHWEWLHSLTDLLGWRLEPLQVRIGAEAVGALPLFRRGRSPVSPRAPFPYVGPVVPAETLPRVLAALRGWQLRHGLLRSGVQFGVVGTAAARSRLDLAPCHPYDDTTFVIGGLDRPESELWQAVRPPRRKAIRQAESAGVAVRRSHPDELVPLVPRLLEQAFGARGEGSPYPNRIGEWAAAQVRSGRVLAWTAVLEEQPVGALLTVPDGPVLLQWIGGCLREHRAAQPNSLLYWRNILDAGAAGYREIDLVGSVDAGVAQFKRSFGATAQPFSGADVTPLPGLAYDLAQGAATALRRRRRG